MEQSQDKQETATSYEQVVAEVAKAKSDPTYKPQLPPGYVLDAEFPDGVYRVRPCIEEFLAHGYKADQYDTFFSSEVVAGKEAWGPGWSDPNWSDMRRSDLPASLHVVSQVRRVGTRTARATAPTRHRFKQYLFGDPSRRLVRNGKIELQTHKVLSNIDELIEKERQGLLSVHHKDGRRVNLAALKSLLTNLDEDTDVFATARPVAPPPNFPLDSLANDTPSGIPMPVFVEGTFEGDPAADRALKHMRADKASEFSEDEPDGSDTEVDPALDPSLDEENTEVDPAGDQAGESSKEPSAEATAVTTEAKPPESEVSATAQTQPAHTQSKSKGDKKGRR